MTENKGAFIALEGGEGSGKSTQAQMLLERLTASGTTSTLVHEPGTTPLGHHLREYLKSKQRIDRDAELLLFEASRAQLMSEIIRPSIRRGVTVVADRFAASSMAYQGYGRRIGAEHVRTLNDFATRGLYPTSTSCWTSTPGRGWDGPDPPRPTCSTWETRDPARTPTTPGASRT